MRTIGVLGGLGPQATLDFEARVHTVSQEVLPAQANTGYPPMVVYYYRHSPFLMQHAQIPVLPLQADPRLLETAKKLGKCADFLVIPSNGVHQLQEALEHASGLPILSMIEVTLREVQRRGWKRVGMVTMGPPTWYAARLEQLGVASAIISHELGERLNRAILSCQAGQETELDRAVAREAIRRLREQHVDGIIMGCSELPLLCPGESDAPDLLNPVQLLAEAAVKYAIASDRPEGLNSA